ncbi:MAG TPA: hypothetical protein VEU29_05810 [Actinomycetota bacterium]|nr:hypothetical protein [Actinomycetota bacterium]
MASGLAAGGLSAIAGTPAAVALPAGVVAAWATALTVDHLRWRDKTTAMGTDGLDAATGEEIVARLRELGVDASYSEFVDEYEGEVYTSKSIVCRNADAATVETVMDEILGR